MKPLAFLLALTVTLLAAEPHPSLPAIGSLDGLGVNIHFTEPQPGELEMIKAAGFRWVRMDLTWAGTERQSGAYDFSAYDRLVAALEKQSLRAVFILDYGNPLYAEPGDKQPFTSRAGTEEFRAAYARWAAAVVAHFAGRGYLFELWNEPNHEGFWKPKPNAQQYAALAKAACVAIEKAAPKEALIGPATSTIDLPFIEECFKAGLLEHWCAVSVHPYRQPAPETVEEEYRTLRLLIRRYAPKDKAIPILSGEWGYSTQYPAFAGKSDAEREPMQAKYLARMFLTNIANDVPLSIWYDWRDDGDDPKEAEHHFGLVRRKYREGEKEVFEPKPAYGAAKTLTTQLAGVRFNKDLSEMTQGCCGNDIDNPVLLFASSSKTRLCVWRGGEGDDRVRIPVSAGRFTAVTISGDKTAIEVARDTDLQLQASDNVAFLRPERPNRLLKAAAAWQRLPLEVFAAAPSKLTLEDTFENPFGEAVTLPGWKTHDEVVSASVRFRPPSSVPQETIDQDMRRARNAGEATVKKHATITRPLEIRIQRASAQTRLLRWLEIRDGARVATFSQHMDARPTNPLSIQVVAPTQDTLPVVVRNPSGEPFSATVRYSFFGGDYSADHANGEVRFSQGQTEAIVILHPERPRDHRWSGNTLIIGDIAAFQISGARRLDPPSIADLSAVGDGDKGVAERAEISAAEPPDGRCPSLSSAIRLRYRFGTGWGFVRILSLTDWPAGDDQKEFPSLDTASRMGIWIYGDGRGLVPRVRFRSGNGTTFQLSGDAITWRGWRFVEMPMQPLEDRPHWGGANDGVIHYPIKWDSIFVLDNVSRQPVEGEVYLSAPTLLY